jgi:6-phosphofructokinase
MKAAGRIERVGVLFSGGPAPSANAVISSAASAFRRHGCTFIGLLHGYEGLMRYDPDRHPLVEGEDYRVFRDDDLWGLRNSRGVCIGTSRVGPGAHIRTLADLADPVRSAGLRQVYDGLCALGLDALVSIGGDGTLRTAWLLQRFQEGLPADAHRVRVVHLPKTIDNDYGGIDFTFGFFTAVDVLAKEVLNLRADALATSRYYVVECMGRRAGWVAYGVAVAGEAHMVVGVEDVRGPLALTSSGKVELDVDALVERVVDLILAREARGKRYGTLVLAEGLAELVPATHGGGLAPDAYGHLSLGRMKIGELIATLAARRYAERTGRSKTIVGVQLGYEARCAAPHAFDVMLGCQLGAGAFRALVEEGLDGHMVSVSGQLELKYVPLSALVDPDSLRTEIRMVRPDSDFHRLAHELATRLPRGAEEGPAR